MTQYFCADCQKPCQPYLCEVGVSSDCCWTRDAALMVIGDDDRLRRLSDSEDEFLQQELTEEEQGEWTGAMRARQRVMSGS